MVNLEISNYSGSYSHLNGSDQLKGISKLKLARAIITAGYRNFRSWKTASNYRKLELLFLTLGNVDITKGKIHLSSNYYSLDQSEKVNVSYNIGNGLTKLYAESFLGLPWIINLRDNPYIELVGKSVYKPKYVFNKSLQEKGSLPDYIAIDSRNKIHILETKANHLKVSDSNIQKAINQVSQINRANLKSSSGLSKLIIETRTACCFSLSKTEFSGLIIDPESEDGYTVDLDITNYLKLFYSQFYHEDKSLNKTIKIENKDFVGQILGSSNIFIGIDKTLYNIVNSSVDILIDTIQYLSEYKSIDTESYSIGIDGIILIELDSKLSAHNTTSEQRYTDE